MGGGLTYNQIRFNLLFSRKKDGPQIKKGGKSKENIDCLPVGQERERGGTGRLSPFLNYFKRKKKKRAF